MDSVSAIALLAAVLVVGTYVDFSKDASTTNTVQNVAAVESGCSFPVQKINALQICTEDLGADRDP
jgi:hypothetical protein